MADEFKHKAVGTSLTEQEWTGIDTHHIDQQATGDLIYATSATQLSRLGIGSAQQFLKVAGGVPTWDDVDASDLTGQTLASSIVFTSITAVGTITTGVWEGTAIAADKGGTNQTSWTAGDLLYASGANTLSRLALGNAGDQLKVTALGTQVAWEAGASGASVGLAMAFAIVF